MEKHKVFISFHHGNDEGYKDLLVQFNRQENIFIDGSVNLGEIDEGLDDQTIRQKIRDEYLRDSTVTIVLVGKETKYRKHVDWEIYSSMYDGRVNKKSGLLVINLPTTGCTDITASHGDEEKRLLYSAIPSWTTCNRTEYETRYPYMPDRLVDNLVKPGVKISVADWNALDSNKLRFLIDVTFNDRSNCDYDLSRPMRRANGSNNNR